MTHYQCTHCGYHLVEKRMPNINRKCPRCEEYMRILFTNYEQVDKSEGV